MKYANISSPERVEVFKHAWQANVGSHFGGRVKAGLEAVAEYDRLQESERYVYVASSWRNSEQPSIIKLIKGIGLDVYDFKNPEGRTGFSWNDVIDPPEGSFKHGDAVSPRSYRQMLDHPAAEAGFQSDFDAMKRADTFVLVLPCGKSAHLELGWAVGQGKRTAILLEDPVEPELMYKMVDLITADVTVLMSWLRRG